MSSPDLKSPEQTGATQATTLQPANEAVIPFRKDAQTSEQQLGFSLGLTLLLLTIVALTLRWLKQHNRLPAAMTSARRMKVLERCRLSPRTTVYLIEFDQETLLITESAHGPACLLKSMPVHKPVAVNDEKPS